MTNKPIATMTGARLEIDGQDVLVVQIPFQTSGDGAQMGNQFCAFTQKTPVVLVKKKGDEIEYVMPNALTKRIQELKPKFDWRQIEMLPDSAIPGRL